MPRGAQDRSGNPFGSALLLDGTNISARRTGSSSRQRHKSVGRNSSASREVALRIAGTGAVVVDALVECAAAPAASGVQPAPSEALAAA